MTGSPLMDGRAYYACRFKMLEHDLWRVIITTLRAGLDAQAYPGVAIKQSFQPIKQGADTQDTVYLYKITSRRVGFQGRSEEYNATNDNFDVTENYWIEGTYQLTALIERNINNSSSITSYDMADLCSGIMQSRSVRQQLLDSGIGILRITDVRNPFSIDDRDQFDQDASFDFILTYNQTIITTIDKATAIDCDIQQI